MRKFFLSFRGDKRLRTAAIFVVVLLIYAIFRSVPPINGFIRSGEHALVVAGTGVGNAIGRLFSNESSTTSRLLACTESLQSATLREAELRQTLRNIDELEQLIGYKNETTFTTTAARIVTRSLPESARVRIDKGTHDGVMAGDAVVVGHGQLFGVVVAVDEYGAEVELLQSKNSKIPAAILGRTHTVGLVEGKEGSIVRMKYIPEGTVIDTGSVVVTSGLDGSLPPNLVIGLVTSVIREETAPFVEALVEPLYDPREWTNLLVVHIR